MFREPVFTVSPSTQVAAAFMQRGKIIETYVNVWKFYKTNKMPF